MAMHGRRITAVEDAFDLPEGKLYYTYNGLWHAGQFSRRQVEWAARTAIRDGVEVEFTTQAKLLRYVIRRHRWAALFRGFDAAAYRTVPPRR